MDDPLFDPWGEESAPAPPPTKPPPKWRPPEGDPPTPPTPPTLARRQTPDTQAARGARLAGAPGFLRTMAAPRIEALAVRLHLARHEAALEDGLDAASPALRFRVKPWRSPFSEELDRGWETLELALEGGSEDQVVVRRWCEATGPEPESEERLPLSRAGAAWLEARLVAFVESVLARA